MVMAIMRAQTMGPAGLKDERDEAPEEAHRGKEVGRLRVSRCRNLRTPSRTFRAYVRTPISKGRTMGAGPTCF